MDRQRFTVAPCLKIPLALPAPAAELLVMVLLVMVALPRSLKIPPPLLSPFVTLLPLMVELLTVRLPRFSIPPPRPLPMLVVVLPEMVELVTVNVLLPLL